MQFIRSHSFSSTFLHFQLFSASICCCLQCNHVMPSFLSLYIFLFQTSSFLPWQVQFCGVILMVLLLILLSILTSFWLVQYNTTSSVGYYSISTVIPIFYKISSIQLKFTQPVTSPDILFFNLISHFSVQYLFWIPSSKVLHVPIPIH